MRILKKFDKNQLFRFFVDGRFHKKYQGWVGYEAGERGSVQALLNGFSFMMDHFDLTAGLEPSYLLDLHKVCMMGVQTKNLKTSPGDLRFLNAGMPFFSTTTTLENVREILDMRKGDGTAVFNTAAYAKPAEMLDADDVYQTILREGKLNYRNWYPNLSKEETRALEKKSGLKAFYEAKHRVQRQFADKVEAIVGRFNADMIDTQSQEARLRSIALLIRELELLHPFPDGNCRTFACVLLTQLLLNYGYTPAILKNPNLDGEYSLDQWIEEIKIGMGVTESLLENPQARVYDYSIDDAKPEDIRSFSDMAKELVQKIESYNEIFLTPQRLQEYTKGRWLVPCPAFMRFSGVGTYNTYSKGNVYFALETAKWIKDGKDIRQELTRVLSKGIKALVLDHAEYADGWNMPVLLVDDAFAAFKAAAVQTRIDLDPLTILVTGTEGKSGAKVQLHHLLGFQTQAHGVRNSANTEVPVLRSLINLRPDDRVEINEVSVGADEAYRVERAMMVSPNLCLFTNIGPNHMDMHKSMDNVLRAKSSVVEGLREGGLCIADADNPYYEGLVDAIRQRKPEVSIITYGSSPTDAGQLLACEFDNERLGWDVHARLDDEFLRYFLPLPHHHAPLSSVGVLLTIKRAGYDAGRAAADFAGFQPYETMGHLLRLHKQGGEILFYDQSRRGGISGMRSAFADIANIKVRGKVVALVGGISVLRDSDWTKEAHSQLAGLINSSPIDRLYTTGNYMQYVTEHLYKQPVKHSEDLDELAGLLVNDIESGDLLFMIGSAYLYLGRVSEKVRQLLKQGGGAVAASASPKSPAYRMLCAYQDVDKGVTAAKAVASHGVHYSDYLESLKRHATFTDFRAALLADFFHRVDALLSEIRPMTCVNAEMAVTDFNRYVVTQQFCRRWFNNFDKNNNLPTKQLFGSFYDFGDPELLLHVQVATVNLHIGFVYCQRAENGYVPSAMSEEKANRIAARMADKGIKNLAYRTWGAKWLSVDLGAFIEPTKPDVFTAMAETADSDMFADKIRPLVESLA
ncbi:MAG: Mur ligase family protein [Methylobacter sp.]